jgi:plasmid maintenance system antidote protein VapI
MHCHRNWRNWSLWLEMQTAYDLWHAERKLSRGIASIPTLQPA